MHALDVPAHQQSISALTSSSDLLATGSSDSSVRIWVIKQGEKGLPTLFLRLAITTETYPRLHRANSDNKFTGSVSTRACDDYFTAIKRFFRFPAQVSSIYTPFIATILAISGTERNVNIWTRSENLVCLSFLTADALYLYFMF